MLRTETLREIGADGAHRLAGAVSETHTPWRTRRRASSTRWLLWVVGCAVGFLLMAGLVWGLSCRDGEAEED